MASRPPAILALAAGLALAASVAPAGAEPVDRLLASVNGQVITETSLARYLALARLVEPVDTDGAGDGLDTLVNRLLLLQEIRRLGFVTLDPEVRRQALAEIAGPAGGRPALDARLAELGLDGEDLSGFLRDRYLIAQFVDQRVGAFVDVLPADLAAAQSELGLDQAGELEPELAGRLRDLVRARKVNARLAELLEGLRSRARIEIVRRPGQDAAPAAAPGRP